MKTISFMGSAATLLLVMGAGCSTSGTTSVQKNITNPPSLTEEPSRMIPQMRIQGVIKDNRTNKPISDMQIVLGGSAGLALPKSDFRGRFSVLIPEGAYKVYAADEDHQYLVDAEVAVDRATAATDLIILMNPVTTVPGTGVVVFPETKVLPSADKKTYIKGRVTDAASGAGVSGLRPVCYQGWCPGNITDATGNFSIELPYGKTLLFYFAPTNETVIAQKDASNYYHVHASTGYTTTINISLQTK